MLRMRDAPGLWQLVRTVRVEKCARTRFNTRKIVRNAWEIVKYLSVTTTLEYATC